MPPFCTRASWSAVRASPTATALALGVMSSPGVDPGVSLGVVPRLLPVGVPKGFERLRSLLTAEPLLSLL